jgi:hypothetical protein
MLNNIIYKLAKSTLKAKKSGWFYLVSQIS